MHLTRGALPSTERTTCLAAGGTFLLEFSLLSRLTGRRRYERAARRSVASFCKRADTEAGLFGSHIDVEKGEWSQPFAGVGASSDSFYEYLLKTSILTGDPDLPEVRL